MRSKAYRASFFVISLLIISFGVNLIVRADMGNSPLTATPYTCSAIIPEITFGTWTIIWSVVMIIVEKILMGRDMGTGASPDATVHVARVRILRGLHKLDTG